MNPAWASPGDQLAVNALDCGLRRHDGQESRCSCALPRCWPWWAEAHPTPTLPEVAPSTPPACRMPLLGWCGLKPTLRRPCRRSRHRPPPARAECPCSARIRASPAGWASAHQRLPPARFDASFTDGLAAIAFFRRAGSVCQPCPAAHDRSRERRCDPPGACRSGFSRDSHGPRRMRYAAARAHCVRMSRSHHSVRSGVAGGPVLPGIGRHSVFRHTGV